MPTIFKDQNLHHVGDAANAALCGISERAIQFQLKQAADCSLNANDRMKATREACGILATSIKSGLIKGPVAA